jgi:hypothetical protein
MKTFSMRRRFGLVLSLLGAACSNDAPSGPASNRAPQIRSVTVTPPVVPVGGSATVTVDASDPDGGTLFYRYEAEGGTITPDGNTPSRAVYKNDGVPRTADRISVTVLDSSSAAATAGATVTLQTNREPRVEITSGSTGCHPNCTIGLDAVVSDPDNDPISYVWSGCASGTGSHAQCSVSARGPVGATVFVHDGRGGYGVASITVNGINSPPSVTRQSNPSIPGFLGVLINDTDDSGGPAPVCGWLGDCSCTGSNQSFNLRCFVPPDRANCFMEFSCTDRFGDTGRLHFDLPE